MAERDKPRRPSRAVGARGAGTSPRDAHLSELSHEMASHVLTMRLLLGSLSSSASDPQREALRMLGEVVEAQGVLARKLSDLGRAPRGAPGPGKPRDG